MKEQEDEAEKFALKHDAERDADDRETFFRAHREQLQRLQYQSECTVKALREEFAGEKQRHQEQIDELLTKLLEQGEKLKVSDSNVNHTVSWYNSKMQTVERERDALSQECALLLQQQLSMLKRETDPSQSREAAVRIRSAELQIEAEHLRNALGEIKHRCESQEAALAHQDEAAAALRAELAACRLELEGTKKKHRDELAHMREVHDSEKSQFQAEVASLRIHIETMTTDAKLRARVSELEQQLRESLATQLSIQTRMSQICVLGDDQFFEVSPQRHVR